MSFLPPPRNMIRDACNWNNVAAVLTIALRLDCHVEEQYLTSVDRAPLKAPRRLPPPCGEARRIAANI